MSADGAGRVTPWTSRMAGLRQAGLEHSRKFEVIGPLLSDEETSTKAAPAEQDRGQLTRLSDVEARPVDWLWPGYVPAGMLVIVEGDPGVGKSTMLTDFAARVSTGRPFPGCSEAREPADVIILTAEDHLPSSVVPRLAAAGGDATRIHAWEFTDASEGRLPVLPDDIDLLRGYIERLGAALVFVDVFSSYLSSRFNAHIDHDIRRALHPLATLAAATGATIVLVRHLNKNANSPAAYRGMGSIGLSGAARTVLLVAPNPNDPSRRVLAVSKSNLAPLAPSFEFELTDADGIAYVQWHAEVPLTASELLAAGPAPTSQLEGAKAFLVETLSVGAVPESEIEGLGAERGISKSTLKRAKAKLGVIAKKGNPHWYWMLPSFEDETSPPTEQAKETKETKETAMDPLNPLVPFKPAQGEAGPCVNGSSE